MKTISLPRSVCVLLLSSLARPATASESQKTKAIIPYLIRLACLAFSLGIVYLAARILTSNELFSRPPARILTTSVAISVRLGVPRVVVVDVALTIVGSVSFVFIIVIFFFSGLSILSLLRVFHPHDDSCSHMPIPRTTRTRTTTATSSCRTTYLPSSSRRRVDAHTDDSGRLSQQALRPNMGPT